jgi:hypothetical protein
VIDGRPTERDRLLSTTNRSKPLRAVQIARESSRQVGSMELFQVLCEIQEQLALATDLQSLLDIIVGLVHELTGFHRVMVSINRSQLYVIFWLFWTAFVTDASSPTKLGINSEVNLTNRQDIGVSI